MDNEKFDIRARELALDALEDAYTEAKNRRSIDGLIKTAELAGKMIDFREPVRHVGFKGKEGGTYESES